jgi:hypothetical protein
MGINDFGGANDPLGNPPLGGPSGWAASVRDALVALQGQHVIRSTRPNTADHLVEVFDGTAWDLVSYDSGWRQCNNLLHANLEVVEGLVLRRIGWTVYAQIGITVSAAGWTTGDAMATLPAGFTPVVMDVYLPTPYGHPNGQSVFGSAGQWKLYLAQAGESYRFNLVWPTIDPVPTGLPGVEFGPAAPAPPPDVP